MKFLIQQFLSKSFCNCPDKIAVKQGDELYSYAEIEKLSNKIANYFKSIGAKKGTLVGILSRVRVEAIAAMIGALKTGVVYVPLNIHAPVQWLGGIIEKSGIKHLLVDPEYFDKALLLYGYGIEKAVSLGREKSVATILNFSAIESTSDEEPESVQLLADDLAYILYTSGSTGDPKGIMLTHRNAYTFIDWMRREFAVNSSDRIFSRAPLQFDLSVFDIYTTFAAGATLFIAPLKFSNKPEDIVSLITKEQITIVYTVPSAYICWLTKGKLERGIPTLRQVLYAGEPFPTPYLKKVMACLPGTRFSNIYGPTETNIVTFYHIPGIPETDEAIPLGHPVDDTEIYIINDDLSPCAPGEMGEILVRGGTVFAGYFNKPELTREKLVQSPFHNYPTLCCRTGDYGRILPDGNIAYHGRMDNMVKTRGYRVEIGEVESAIAAFNDVVEVAVVTKPHEKYSNTLHAFVVLNDGIEPASGINAIKEHLGECIPSYMMPFEFIPMQQLPKTATDKVDRVGLRQLLMTSDNQVERTELCNA